MKVLTATKRTQGVRHNDFSWTVEGELVAPPAELCEADMSDPDGGCGCNRSWSGVSSRRATTTATVRDLSMSRDDYVCAIQDGYTRAGWDVDAVEGLADDLLALAGDLAVGAVVEIRDGVIGVREGGVRRCL